MRIGDISLLTRSEDVCDGDACLYGTRLRVDVVVYRFVAAGESVAEIAVDYGVSKDAVEQALRLVLYACGTSLLTQRAIEKIAKVLPLEPKQRSHE